MKMPAANHLPEYPMARTNLRKRNQIDIVINNIKELIVIGGSNKALTFWQYYYKKNFKKRLTANWGALIRQKTVAKKGYSQKDPLQIMIINQRVKEKALER